MQFLTQCPAGAVIGTVGHCSCTTGHGGMHRHTHCPGPVTSPATDSATHTQRPLHHGRLWEANGNKTAQGRRNPLHFVRVSRRRRHTYVWRDDTHLQTREMRAPNERARAGMRPTCVRHASDMRPTCVT